MTGLLYSLRIYNDRQWLKSEEFFLSSLNAKQALMGEKHYVLTMYELMEPMNPVALLNRINFARRFEIIEDTRKLVG